MAKPAFIYRIINLKNGLSYVGATTLNPPIKRWQKHLAVARLPHVYNGNHTFQKLHQAIREDSPQSFKFEVLEETLKSKRFGREKFWIRKIGSFGQYNSTLGGKGTPGVKISEENKQKLSEMAKESQAGSKNNMYGRHHTEEAKRRIGEGRRRAKRRRDAKRGENNPFFGHQHSEASRELMKESWKDREYEKEWVLKRTKFTTKDVILIRQVYKDKTMTVKELARKYECSVSGIYKLIKQQRKVDR